MRIIPFTIRRTHGFVGGGGSGPVSVSRWDNFADIYLLAPSRENISDFVFALISFLVNILIKCRSQPRTSATSLDTDSFFNKIISSKMRHWSFFFLSFLLDLRVHLVTLYTHIFTCIKNLYKISSERERDSWSNASNVPCHRRWGSRWPDTHGRIFNKRKKCELTFSDASLHLR